MSFDWRDGCIAIPGTVITPYWRLRGPFKFSVDTVRWVRMFPLSPRWARAQAATVFYWLEPRNDAYITGSGGRLVLCAVFLLSFGLEKAESQRRW